MRPDRPHLDVRLRAQDRLAALRADVTAGLTARSKSLPSRWLYDGAGSDLFERITQVPEYYPTRAERAILEAHAGEVAAAARTATLVELGSGSSTKTRLLIDAMVTAGTLRRFTAFDVAEDAVVQALDGLRRDYPDLEFDGIIGDFETDLDALARPATGDADRSAGGARTVAFLGGTIGNLEPPARKAFLGTVADILAPGETLLLGADLVKDPGRLVAAYDDPAGVTEAFEKNVLLVCNAALGSAFDPDDFAYRAVWSEVAERIEMGLVARRGLAVEVPGLGLTVHLEEGEMIRTEVSAKFRLPALGAELVEAGFDPVASWTDPPGDFALVLARKDHP